jgi:tetratricopeptide (TPR) repeat protein
LLTRATGRSGTSLFVAAVFAFHPLNVESVAWVAQRKNVLCTLLFFLTLCSYGWYAQKPSWKRYAIVTGLFAAGLASKPMVITLPFVLLLLDYWPLKRLRSDKDLRWAHLLVEKLPLLVLSTANGIITVMAQRGGGSIRTTAEFSFPVRIANAIYAYILYLSKMVWPARLAPFYPHLGGSISAWRVVLATLILIIITAAVWKYRTHRYLPVGWFWFLGTLVPVIGLLQVGEAAMADRYAYIPLIGIFAIVGFGTAEMAQHKNLGFWPAIPATAILVVLAFLTHRQIAYWSSNEELWSHTLMVTDNNFVAENNLAGALILKGTEDEAYPHFQAAARINPHDPMSRSNLGTYYRNHGQLREAAEQYESAVALTSEPGLLALTYANLGSVQIALGEPDRAHENLQRSLQYNSTQFNAWLGLGLLAEKQGNLPEAIADLSRSVEAQPTGQAFLELGRCLTQAGRTTEALQAYDDALKTSPGLAEAQRAADELRQSRR